MTLVCAQSCLQVTNPSAFSFFFFFFLARQYSRWITAGRHQHSAIQLCDFGGSPSHTRTVDPLQRLPSCAFPPQPRRWQELDLRALWHGTSLFTCAIPFSQPSNNHNVSIFSQSINDKGAKKNQSYIAEQGNTVDYLLAVSHTLTLSFTFAAAKHYRIVFPSQPGPKMGKKKEGPVPCVIFCIDTSGSMGSVCCLTVYFASTSRCNRCLTDCVASTSPM